MKLYIVTFLLHFIFFYSEAQVIPHVRYTSKDGLIADRITAITQDEKGFMWFGSFFGICTYDGTKFTKVSLPPKQQNKYVTFLLPANNKIYAGFLFQGGLAEFTNGKVTSHFIKGKDSATSNEFTSSSYNNDGSILICNTKREIYQFVNNKFQYLYTVKKSTSTPASIVKDKYNNIWLGTDNGLVIVPPPYKSEEVYFKSADVISLIKDKQGNIIFTRIDSNKTVIETYNGWQNGFLKSNAISTLSTLQAVSFSGNTDKGLWGVDMYKGLVNFFNNQQNSYKIPFQLNSIVNIIFADRENNIWVANEPGVIKVTNHSVKTFYFEELAPGGSHVMQENDSVIWVTNSKYLYRIQGNSFFKVPEFRFNNEGYISTFKLDAHKNLWITFWDGGIVKTRWNGSRLITLKSFEKKLTGQLMMIRDTVWVIGQNGIFLIKNDVVINHFRPITSNGSPSLITAYAMDEKQRQLWVGDNSFGLSKIDFSNAQNLNVTEYITSKNGLKDMTVRSLMLDKNQDLWIGTRFGGIFKLIKNPQGKYLVEDVTRTAAVECTRTTQIIEEKDKAAWFATCNGVYRYTYNTKQWEQYNTGNGLVNAEIFSIVFDEKKQRLWAAGAEGVSELNVLEKLPGVLPLVSLVDITILGRSDTSALYSTSPIKYAYDRNSIGFVFAGASFIDEKRIQYKYKLEGYDKEWSRPTLTNSVNYASLPAGKYVFQVFASNASGEWSKMPATFTFIIDFPFWKTWWFILTIAITVCFLLYFLYRYRLQQALKVERLRSRISTDLHDDIGSTLSSISILSEISLVENKKIKTHEILKEIKTNAHTLMERMDDIVWSINPKNDSLENLMLRIRQFAANMFESKEIEYDIIIGNEVKNVKLPMDTRQHIYMILKEAINNLMKYADCKNARIEVTYQDHKLFISIWDNGIGFNENKIQRGNGLSNMRSRANAINGQLNIKSEIGKGTTVSLKLKIR